MVKSFSGKGEGPGELKLGSTISVDRQGIVYVMDNIRKVVVYDNNGMHMKDLKTASFGLFSKAKVLADGCFLGSRMGESLMATLFNTETKKILKEYPLLDYDFVLSGNSKQVLAIHPDYLGRHLFLDEADGSCLMAESQRYWVKLMNSKGDEVYTIEKEIKRQELTRDEINSLADEFYSRYKQWADKRAIIKSIEDYKHKNIILTVKLTTKYAYVFLVPQDICKKDYFPVDIYDLKGKLKKKALFSKKPGKIVDHFAYVIEEDEQEDTRKLVKYRIGAF